MGGRTGRKKEKRVGSREKENKRKAKKGRKNRKKRNRHTNEWTAVEL